jgi:tetratricopeptide (TPR) repeat protein
MTYRVRTRNVDWQNEISIYESSLAVCPDNVRALNNVGMLKAGTGRALEAVEHLDRFVSPPSVLNTLAGLSISIRSKPQPSSTPESSIPNSLTFPSASIPSLYSHSLTLSRALCLLQHALSLPVSSNLAASYLGIVHAQYYFYLTSSSSQPVAHLISLLLASRSYSTLSTALEWNTPTGYLTAANVELELVRLRNKGQLSPSFSLRTEVGGAEGATSASPLEAMALIEKNILKAIDLNHRLELLSRQGVPVQDTIDSYSAYNQLGLLYMLFVEQKALTESERRIYFTEAQQAFEMAISLNSQRYEAKVNLATLFSNAGSLERALGLYDEVLSPPLGSQAESGVDERRPSVLLWNNRGDIEEKLGRVEEAKRSYQKAFDGLEAMSGGAEHPSYRTVCENLNRVKEIR